LSGKKGKLYVVSTPIGNLGDITFRAVNILNSVGLVASEDTRHSRKLFSHYKIRTKLISYFEHNKISRIPKLIRYLKDGNDLGLITDAGTPGISDPAYRIVREAIKNSVEVIPIPGASAFIAGLVTSGLPTDRFIFEGFLPTKKGRIKKIENIKNVDATLIYYESPHRISKTLDQLNQMLGDRPAVVARELTKVHEEIRRGTLSELCLHYKKQKPKGECVILVAKDDENVYF
tara:strand:+ start:93 stop:788 length:696 start_codon:yes stop_codon:yes gene_type:complete